jgi:hypothetical protein
MLQEIILDLFFNLKFGVEGSKHSLVNQEYLILEMGRDEHYVIIKTQEIVIITKNNNQITEAFQTNRILILNGSNKFKTSIEYANQFRINSKHNFVYWMESSDFNFEFICLAKQLDIDITNNQKQTDIDKIIKRIYNELNIRCHKRTHVLFVFNNSNDPQVLLDFLQVDMPKNVYILITSNNLSIKFDSIQLKSIEHKSTKEIGIKNIGRWNLMKYYSVLYSSFIPNEIVEYLQIKLDNERLKKVYVFFSINNNFY